MKPNAQSDLQALLDQRDRVLHEEPDFWIQLPPVEQFDSIRELAETVQSLNTEEPTAVYTRS
ncbi:MAG: hypothetical protein ACLQU4_11960 [Limisphaerales bacterium]